MSSEPSSHAEGPRRKRIRKGTRSCWECKRRKIKCVYPSEDHAICAGCADKQTRCISQEYDDVQSLPDTGNVALGQRMAKVESLLEKLMEKMAQSTPAAISSQLPQPILPDRDQDQGGAPYHHFSTPQAYAETHSNMVTDTSEDTADAKSARLRRELTSLLPCQADVDYLTESSRGWWLIQRHIMPGALRTMDDDGLSTSHIVVASCKEPAVIARVLLVLALCIQQLPPEFDPRRLQVKASLHDMINRIMKSVTALFIADDSVLNTVGGLECVVLYSVYQVNDGSLRRAWLSFRRAMAIAQLMGIHRAPHQQANNDSNGANSREGKVWYQIIRGERYLSLLLGVPSATGLMTLTLDCYALGVPQEDIYEKELCNISGLILARNQGDLVSAFSSTLEIDEKLDSLAKRMPKSWWELPTNVIMGRTDEAAAQSERLSCQIWHFELRTLTNLPFMLRASTDRRYEYFRSACLDASRGLIRTWIAMRHAFEGTFISKLTEFQAFTAVVTLMLGLLGSAYGSNATLTVEERSADQRLVEAAAQILERRTGNCASADAVEQSGAIIRALQDVLQDGIHSRSNLRLVIPYFGTISIARSGTVQSLEGERFIGANPVPGGVLAAVNPEPPAERLDVDSRVLCRSMAGTGQPQYPTPDQTEDAAGYIGPEDTALKFTSSQFPAFETQTTETPDWIFEESDILFFDSLLNTDLTGNWAG